MPPLTPASCLRCCCNVMSSCSFYKVPVHDSCLDNSLRAPAPSIWDWIFRTMIRLERGAMCPSECSAGINAINQRPEKAVRDGADPCPWLQFPPVLASTLTDVDLCLPNQRTAPQPSWCHSAAICCCFFRLSIFDVRASWTDHQLHCCSSSLFWFRFVASWILRCTNDQILCISQKSERRTLLRG